VGKKGGNESGGQCTVKKGRDRLISCGWEARFQYISIIKVSPGARKLRFGEKVGGERRQHKEKTLVGPAGNEERNNRIRTNTKLTRLTSGKKKGKQLMSKK